MTTETPDKAAPAIITGKTYDQLKFAALIGLPALGTLYFAVASIWGLPSAEQVVGTIVAIDTCLGALLGISSKQYTDSGAKYSGAINVLQKGDKKVYSLDLDADPETLDGMPEVTFKVNTPPPEPKAVYTLSPPPQPPEPSQPSQ